MPKVYQRALARRDLLEHFVYLAEHASVDAAERFIAAAETTFSAISHQPLMGAPLALAHPDLAGMRKWRINGFDNHLVFYLPRSDGVSVVRVLHASRDWWALLGLET
jgi:toxin ParE1/3/4